MAACQKNYGLQFQAGEFFPRKQEKGGKKEERVFTQHPNSDTFNAYKFI